MAKEITKEQVERFAESCKKASHGLGVYIAVEFGDGLGLLDKFKRYFIWLPQKVWLGKEKFWKVFYEKQGKSRWWTMNSIIE